MAALSPEEENYVRMALLLTGVSPRAVRALFDREFAPLCLKATISKEGSKLSYLMSKKVINPAQWKLLYPSTGNVESKTFDVTLMICLIRNLTTLAPPVNGFDSLPPPGDITPCADLARIKYYRNDIAHLDDDKIENSDFTTAWNDISDAVGRLGGPAMLQECKELKNKILDQSNQEIMLEIKFARDEINELKTSIEYLKSSYNDLQSAHFTLQCEYSNLHIAHNVLHSEYQVLQTEHTEIAKQVEALKESHKDTVPWNIRVQIQKRLETWMKNDDMFVDTRASKHVLKRIKKGNCVTVTASSGVGKTATVQHVALQMAKNGYDIIPVDEPSDISKFYNPNQKTLFVVDDLCGRYSLIQADADKWKLHIRHINPLLQDNTTKIIVSCRLQVYQDEKFENLSLFKSCECNLLSDKLRLSSSEKMAIATNYLGMNATEVQEYFDLYDFFPLLCKLYAENPNVNISEFFCTPYVLYESELNKLCKEGTVKYCALALCVMFNNNLNEESLTEEVDKDIMTVIKNTFEACKLSRNTSRLVIRDDLDSLLHTFIRKEGKMYSTIHSKVFDFLAYYFGSVMITCLIKNASSGFIRERVLYRREGCDPYIIVVPDIHKQMYIKRLIDDLFKNNVTDVFQNKNMHVEGFRHEFLCYLHALPTPDQNELAHKTDKGLMGDTVLIMCCFLGDIYLVKWCLSFKVDVNQRRLNGISALFEACYGGLSEIVICLLNNNADINNSDNQAASPLFFACENNLEEIVTILLNNNADVNKSTNIGLSPLWIACAKGYTEIVNMLLNDNNVDINKSTTEEDSSPLLIACQQGFNEIVNILLKNKADVNKCNNRGNSPLIEACINHDHGELVKILLTNKADINKCNDNGESPMLVACAKGYTEIVKILITNNIVDINKCNNQEESPLLAACMHGYTDIVNILVMNEADINKCSKIGLSPLLVACAKGHTEIVNILIQSDTLAINKCPDQSAMLTACFKGHTENVNCLLNNEAGIKKCNEGLSPLLVACVKGDEELVKILLRKKADINVCFPTGVSLLCVAYTCGHSEIVNILLRNTADLNKCLDNGETHLLVACREGHSELVTGLLTNGADINKCNYNGESPIFLACVKGHTEIVNTLLQNKADINKCNYYGLSPLLVACEKCNTEIVNTLVHNKADINKCNNKGASPLLVACMKGHTDIVNILINNGADINKCADLECSALFIACFGCHTEIVKTLLQNRADINKCSNTGESPLFVACIKGHTDIVDILLNNGADINKCNNNGLSPLQVAMASGQSKIMTILLQHTLTILNNFVSSLRTVIREIIEITEMINSDFGRH